MSEKTAGDNPQVEISADELRRLRGAVGSANKRVSFYAAQVTDLSVENARLQDQLRASHGQLRIMRHSVVWRAGAVLRQSKRLAGIVVRNVVGMVTK